jgi:signal transduction histidine kinase
LKKTASKERASADLLELKRIEECLERRNMSFDALFRFLEKLGTTFDLKKIVRLFLMTIMGQLKLKRIVFHLAVPSGKRLVMYHSLGIARHVDIPGLDAASSFVRWIRDARGFVHLDTYYADIGDGEDGETEMLLKFSESNLTYAYPLRDQEQLVGTLFFGGKVTGEGFAEFDIDLLEMLSKVASISIRNAWLYQAAVFSRTELERFSKVKTEFINHTSHELRTPLTVLKSSIWSIEPEEVTGGVMIDMAKDALLRLESKVEHLLSLNDIQLRDTALDVQRIDVSSLLENCLREIIPEVEEKQVTVRFNDRAQFKEVMMDAAKMKVVFRCIIDNAVNFVQRGGNITITTNTAGAPPCESDGVEIGAWNEDSDETALAHAIGSAVQEQQRDVPREGESEFRTARDRSYLVVRIEDDGIGIPTEEIKCLSEPFKRASNSALKNVKGLGVGLSVSQKIISGHKGRLFCRSASGRGAEFSIWLPLMD